MRILIESDEAKTTMTAPAASLAAVTVSDAADAGAGPSGSASQAAADSAAENGGAPPQWLVDTITKDMAGSEQSGAGDGSYTDGGSGPS